MLHAGYVTRLLALVVAVMLPLAPVHALDDEDGDELGAAAVARFLRKHLPEHLDELHGVLEEQGSEAYAEALDDAQDLLEDYHHFRDLEPGLGDVFLRSQRLDHRIAVIAEQLWEVDEEPARSAATADLRAAVSEQFDLDLQLEQAEVRELDRQLEFLRRELQERQARRDALVDEEVTAILSDDGDDEEEGGEGEDDD